MMKEEEPLGPEVAREQAKAPAEQDAPAPPPAEIPPPPAPEPQPEPPAANIPEPPQDASAPAKPPANIPTEHQLAGRFDELVRDSTRPVYDAEYGLHWTYDAASQIYVNDGYWSIDASVMVAAKGVTATVAGLLDRARTSGLARFVARIKDVDARDCALVGVRVENGVKSIILLPQPDGSIVEVGTRVGWSEPPDVSSVEEFVRSDVVTPRPVFDITQENLATVLASTKACYAIFWHYKCAAPLREHAHLSAPKLDLALTASALAALPSPLARVGRARSCSDMRRT
jgi:hypothetical protein